MWPIMNFMTRSLRKISAVPCRVYLPLLLILSITFLLLAGSCSKPAGTIGAIINPDQSRLRVAWSDTSTLYAYSSPDDSVRSDNLGSSLLGSHADPVFGTTTAGFYVQFFLSAFEHDFGENPQPDSVVLQLLYTGDSHGDTTTPIQVQVYQLEEDIFRDSVYFSNVNLETGTTDFADFSFVPLPNDSVVIEGDTLEAILRIPLNNTSELGEYLVNAPELAMESSDDFVDYFKGLYVTATAVAEGGSLIYFDLIPNTSRMTLYYSNTEEDSLRFEYLITSSTARVGQYVNDFDNASAAFRQQVVEGDTLLGRQQFYLKGLGSVNTTIKLPFIREWNNVGAIAINEAKLILTGMEKPQYGAPRQLALFLITEDGSRALLPDITEGDDYFGGFYKASGNNYTFRITRYVQDLLIDTSLVNNGLSLFVNNPWLTPESIIINGNEPAADTAVRLKLELLYTKLD